MSDKYTIKGTYAGIVFEHHKDVALKDIKTVIERIKNRLKRGETKQLIFKNEEIIATKLCVDVLDPGNKIYKMFNL